MSKNKIKNKADSKTTIKWWKTTLILVLAFLSLAVLAVTAMVFHVATHIDYAADEKLFQSAKGNRTTRIYACTPGAESSSYFGDLSLAPQEKNTALSHLPHDYHPTELTEERIVGMANGIFCPIADIPTEMKNAFVAIEDQRFYSHCGVDFARTVKAALNYIFRFDRRFGASTITQQVIKNISSDDEITLSRKLREIFRALHLEKNHSKDEILEVYLNIVPMANGCVGVGAAAEYYYGKSVGELSLAECASLAAITNLPSRYDPLKNPTENRSRKELILGKMLERGMIGEREYERAMGESPVTVSREGDTARRLSWYTETVISDVTEDLMREYGLSREMAQRMIYGGGLSIYTAQDIRVQTGLESYFENLSHFSSAAREGMQYAMVVIDPGSGDLLGIVGSVGEKKGNRLFNYATDARRAPGSALKPLSVYAPALEEGVITWASVYDDVPLTFSQNGAWPHNSPQVYSGLTDIYRAVVESKNTVAVQVLEDLGIERSYAYLTRRLGLLGITRGRYLANGDKVTDLAPAPLALGQLSDGVSLRALTTAYGALADGGVYHPSRSYLLVLDKDGEVLLEKKEQGSRAFSESTAFLMTEMLRGVVEQGTARSLTLDEMVDTAGKTGTSGSGQDKWFIGYTPYLLAGIWCGWSDGSTAVSADSQNQHLHVWDAVMRRLHREMVMEEDARRFTLAPGVVRAVYCPDSGGIPCEACRKDPRGGRIAIGYFKKGSEPKKCCHTHLLVDYDYAGGGVATDFCPLRDTEKVGMLFVTDRAFPKQVYVTDAQYVYRAVGDGDTLPETDKEPFFARTLGEGVFVGISKTADGRQFNAACPYHSAETSPPDDKEKGMQNPPWLNDWFRRYFSFRKS